MIKYKLKKVLCALTVGVMILSSVSGCAEKKEDTASSVTKTSSSTNDSQKPMYPIVDKPLTLSYWVPMHPKASQFMKSLNENEAYQEIEKKTGIHINFIHPASGQEKEQFNMLIASKDLPDIICVSDSSGKELYSGGEFKGVGDGAFVNLAPYLEKNATDYLKLINSNAEFKREVTGDGGLVAAFYRVKIEQDPQWRRPVLRGDWLKEAGLEVPRTIDDYEKVFKAFKEKRNIAPYALRKDGKEDMLAGAYGVIPELYLKDDKTVSYGMIQPQFKEYLTLMNKWFTAGYISKDFPSMENADIIKTFNSEKAGMYIDSVDAAFNDSVTLKRDYVSAPSPRVKLGDKLHNNMAEWPKGNDVTVVSSTSKHKEEAIKWLNYAFTVEGSRLLNYGVEGKSWVMENGQPKFTDYLLKNPNNPNYTLKAHFAPKLCDPDVKALPALFINPGASDFRKKWSDDKDVDSAYRIPPIKLTKEELDRRAKIMSEVNTYSDEKILKFIIGAEPLGNFDNYVSQMKKLGIDEAIKITQDAYTRYIAK